MTKEEILKNLGFNATQQQIAGGFIFNQQAYKFTLEAMELYAQQEVQKALSGPCKTCYGDGWVWAKGIKVECPFCHGSKFEYTPATERK